MTRSLTSLMARTPMGLLVLAAACVFAACGGDGGTAIYGDGDVDTSDQWDIPDTSEFMGPQIQASLTAIEFNSVETGASVTQAVTLTNSGDTVLYLRSASLTGPDAGSFSLEGYAEEGVEPGQGKTFTVRFSPASAGEHYALLTIDNLSFNNPALEINLHGSGVEPSLKLLTVGGLANDGGLHFGELQAGGSRTVSIYFKNSGTTGPLSISGLAFDVSACQNPGIFSVSVAGHDVINAAQPLQLRVNERTTALVSYLPLEAGAHACVLRIISDSDDAAADLSIPVDGSAVPADLLISPNPVDFGAVGLREPKTITVNLTNQTEDSITVFAVMLSSFVRPEEYTTDPTIIPRFDLAAGGNYHFDLIFNPAVVGRNDGLVQFSTSLSSSSILSASVAGSGGVANDPPVALVSLTSHGAPIDASKALLFEPGATQMFYGDSSTDADSGHQITEYQWTLLTKPLGSQADFIIGESPAAAGLTFDKVGDYQFTLEVKDNEDAWSTPFLASAQVVGSDTSIRIEMNYTCQAVTLGTNEVNVDLGWQVPANLLCTQENAPSGGKCVLRADDGKGNSYGNAIFTQFSNGCNSGGLFMESMTHTGMEVDGAYYIYVIMRSNCLKQLGTICTAGNSTVTVKVYLNNAVNPTYTLTTTVTESGQQVRWGMLRKNGVFQTPVLQ